MENFSTCYKIDSEQREREREREVFSVSTMFPSCNIATLCHGSGTKRVERNEEEKGESSGLDKSAHEKEMLVAMG